MIRNDIPASKSRTKQKNMRDNIDINSELAARLEVAAENGGITINELIDGILLEALESTGRISTSKLAERRNVSRATVLRNWRKWGLVLVGQVARGEFEFSLHSVISYEKSHK